VTLRAIFGQGKGVLAHNPQNLALKGHVGNGKRQLTRFAAETSCWFNQR
jgi:hypothetical protein